MAARRRSSAPCVTVVVVACMLMIMAGRLEVARAARSYCPNILGKLAGQCQSYLFAGKPSPSSGCCTTIKSVNVQCLCSQIPAGSFSALSPTAASNIRDGCGVKVPRGLKCAGFGK